MTATADAPTRRGWFRRHRRVILGFVGAAAVFGCFYFVVPEIAGLGSTLHRLRSADKWWLALGVLVEAVSIAGQIALLHDVFSGPDSPIGWHASVQITLAGTAATKLIATAGAGGVALTVWSMRALGLPEKRVTTDMLCYEVVNYSIYMASLVFFGFGLWLGIFGGPAPIWLTLIPALFGAAVILIVISTLLVDGPVERFLKGRINGSGARASRWWKRADEATRDAHIGLLAAITHARRRDSTFPSALCGWAFDIAALWASFLAFGHAPSIPALVMGYFVGTLGNALPLPGGVGGVEGGMIGAFLGFGVPGSLAVLAVLAYRTISYWLPTVPGVIAYVRLRKAVGAKSKAV
jgi:putative heme transporter